MPMTSLHRHNWLVLTILTEYLLSGRNWKFKYFSGTFHAPKAVPCFRRLVAGLSTRRAGFDRRSVHVRFVLDEVAMGQGFLRTTRFSLVYITPPNFHTHLHLHVALTSRRNEWSLGTFQKQRCFGNPIEPERKLLSLTSYSGWLKPDAWRCGMDWKVSGSNPAMGMFESVSYPKMSWATIRFS
jgi:hypothetical protein